MMQWREEPVESPVRLVWHDLSERPPHYVALGLDMQATQQEIRNAYRSLMPAVHPDRCSVGEQAIAHQRAAALNEAYGVLRDPTRRAAYDRQYGQG